MKLYADADPRGNLPGLQSPTFGLTPGSWVYGLTAHLGDVDKVRICPSDAQSALRRQRKGSSYVLNEYTSTDPRPNSGGIRPNGIIGPGGEQETLVTPVRREIGRAHV